MHGVMLSGAQGCGIVMTEFFPLFRRKIFLFGLMQMLFHLPHNMLGFVMVLDFEICRRLCNLVGMTAIRAEFPFLETIHVRKGPASSRAPDDEVHDIWVLCGV